MYSSKKLSSYISNKLINHNILLPEDLTIDNLSNAFNVVVDYFPAKSTVINSKEIWLDSRLNQEERYNQFLHELAHCVLDDPMLIKYSHSIYQYYEKRKKTIVKFLAVPKHMIKYIKLTSNNLLHELSFTFHLKEDIALEVIEYFKVN